MEITQENLRVLSKTKKKLLTTEDKLTQARGRIYSKTKEEGGKKAKKFYYNPSPEYQRMKNGQLHDDRKQRTIQFKKELNAVNTISRAIAEGLSLSEKGGRFVGINNFKPTIEN